MDINYIFAENFNMEKELIKKFEIVHIDRFFKNRKSTISRGKGRVIENMDPVTFNVFLTSLLCKVVLRL